jgi:hypothetical protein
MGTRTLSFLQLCQEVDPFFRRDLNFPWIYEMSNGRLFYGNPSPYPQFPQGLANSSGVLELTDATGYPTSPAGLAPGAVWNDAGKVGIVPGHAPQPGAPAVYLSTTTALAILNEGAGQWPLVAQASGSGILWNNNGIGAVS